MNKAETYIIPYKGLSSGKYRYEFPFGPEFFAPYPESGVLSGTGSVEIELTRAAASLILDVRIAGRVTVECDRCLEECTLPVNYTGTLTVKFSETPGPYDGEVLWLDPAEGQLDLRQYIYESILLSLPYQRVHPLDAAGNPTCDADMLSRFKIVSGEEFDRLAGSEKTADNPEWQKLEVLRERFGAEEKEGNQK